MQGRILRKLISAASLWATFAVGAWAEAPLTTSIPQIRPHSDFILEEVQADAIIGDVIGAVGFSGSAPAAEPAILFETRPQIRPANLVPVVAKPPSSAAKQCKNNALMGEVAASIPGKLQGCGVVNPVKITAVHGIALSRPATVDCATANAFADWTKNSVIRQFGKKKREVVTIEVLASYSCRTRNNKKGAKISEHGKGRAIDVGSFVLDDGSRVSVFVDWKSKKWGKTMKAIHKGACGPFGTVLGPNADVYHKDHFHMDTARYRSGPYCR